MKKLLVILLAASFSTAASADEYFYCPDHSESIHPGLPLTEVSISTIRELYKVHGTINCDYSNGREQVVGLTHPISFDVEGAKWKKSEFDDTIIYSCAPKGKRFFCPVKYNGGGRHAETLAQIYARMHWFDPNE